MPRDSWSYPRRTLAVIALAVAASVCPRATLGAQLRVRVHNRWMEWWRPDSTMPARVQPSRVLTSAIQWRERAPGVSLGELSMSGLGEAWRMKVVLVRLDPARVALHLDADVREDGAVRPWTINATASARDALVALNAGQFTDRGPWGWIVHEGRELQAPGHGALAGALVVRADGRMQLVDPDSVSVVRERRAPDGIREAVQSYPTLLTSGARLPDALRGATGTAPSIDREHRDARLALGELPDGQLLIVMTRFDGLGRLLERVPFGLTVVEMAALMGGLGCQRALMLDGGISAQLAVSDTRGRRRAWAGLRRVPLGLVAAPRVGATGGWANP